MISYKRYLLHFAEEYLLFLILNYIILIIIYYINKCQIFSYTLFFSFVKGDKYLYNLYYDYWNLITKLSPGSSKWNTPFVCFFNWIRIQITNPYPPDKMLQIRIPGLGLQMEREMHFNYLTQLGFIQKIILRNQLGKLMVRN